MSKPAVPGDGRLAETTAAIGAAVRSALLERRDEGETLQDPRDLKSAHAIDARAAGIARRALRGFHCNLVVEGDVAEDDPDAAFCVYLDPVDGSLNWDRGIGDPALVLAVAHGPRAGCIDELAFVGIEALRSGDRYWTADGDAFHRCALSGRRQRLRTAAPRHVREAVGYLRAGYGGARRQLARTLPLYLAARDLRAVDNAATEFGEIARNAAHFLVEARGISDGFNLLAWPLVRAAGGVLRGLDGSDIVQAPFTPAAATDYVLAGNPALADDLLSRLQRFEVSGRGALEALMERIQ